MQGDLHCKGACMQIQSAGVAAELGSAWWWTQLGIIQPLRLEKSSEVKGTDTVHHSRAHSWIQELFQEQQLHKAPQQSGFCKPSTHLTMAQTQLFSTVLMWHDDTQCVPAGKAQWQRKPYLVCLMEFNGSQYVTWSKFIHIAHTTHSQIQQHFLCKYQIKQSGLWQFPSHATIRSEF